MMSKLLRAGIYLIFILSHYNTHSQTLSSLIRPEIEGGVDVVALDDGFVILVQSRDNEGSGDDIGLIKCNVHGGVGTVKTLIWEEHQYPSKIIRTSDGGLLVVGSSWVPSFKRMDVVLWKFDQQLNISWHSILGSNQREEGLSVVEAQNGDFLVTGMAVVSPNPGQVLVIRTDANGQQLWRTELGSIHKEYGFDLVEQANGEIVVVAEVDGHYGPSGFEHTLPSSDILLYGLNPDGTELWKNKWATNENDQVRGLINNSSGELFLIGATQSTSAGSFDMLLIKTNDRGQEIFHRTYGAAPFEVGTGIDLCANGDILITGHGAETVPTGKTIIHNLRVNPNGDVLWYNTAGGSEMDKSGSITAVNDTTIVVVGSTESFGENKDIFFSVLDEKGDMVTYSNIAADDNQVISYPNPTNSFVTIVLDEELDMNESFIELFDSSGDLMFAKHSTSTWQWRLDLSTYPAGSYTYRISKSAKVLYQGTLVKQ